MLIWMSSERKSQREYALRQSHDIRHFSHNCWVFIKMFVDKYVIIHDYQKSHLCSSEKLSRYSVYIYIHFKDTRTPHSEPRPVLIEVSLIATHFSSATFEGLNRLFQCGKKGTKISHYRFCKGHSSAWSWGLFLITGYTSYRQGLYWNLQFILKSLQTYWINHSSEVKWDGRFTTFLHARP